MFGGIVLILATIWALPRVCKGSSKVAAWVCNQFRDSAEIIKNAGKKGR